MKKYILGSIIVLIILLPYFYFVIIYHNNFELLQESIEYKPALSTRIYDKNGILISELYNENRKLIKIEKVPTHVKFSFIAAEDKNFYKHNGIDILGIIRALFTDIFSGKIQQGGSTITQQLIKQLCTSGERTINRKIIEILLINSFESKYTKDQILEMYLNNIYFGHGIYGINSAALFFFKKEVQDLNIYESSLLAAIISAPNRMSPFKNPNYAYKRQKQILLKMINNNFIHKNEVTQGFKNFWGNYIDEINQTFSTYKMRNKTINKAPHFTEHIRRILVKKYGEDKVYNSGMRVYTTLDLFQQSTAQKILDEQIKTQQKIAHYANKYKLAQLDRIIAKKILKKTDKKPSWKKIEEHSILLKNIRDNLSDSSILISLFTGNRKITEMFEKYNHQFNKLKKLQNVEGAFISLNPGTGAVHSMIGGSTFYFDNQLNRAIQSRRQPGSAFKPFVYAAAFEANVINAATSFNDLPIIFKDKKQTWIPSNCNNSFSGTILVRKAIALSINIVPILIYNKIGGNRIINLSAKLMSIPTSRFENDPTLALGTSEVSLLELARGYAVFANQGKKVNPYIIEYILDRNGKKIYTKTNYKSKRIITEETAYIMTDLLTSVVNNGTAFRPVKLLSGFKNPAAGKTGTNSEYRDAWFVGYTPDLLAAVWLGCDSQFFTLGYGQFGAVAAAPVWGKFMQKIYKNKKTKYFPKPPKSIKMIKVCKISGKLPTKKCPVIVEKFSGKQEVIEKCDGIHKKLVSIFDLIKDKNNNLKEKENFKFDKEEKEKEKEINKTTPPKNENNELDIMNEQ